MFCMCLEFNTSCTISMRYMGQLCYFGQDGDPLVENCTCYSSYNFVTMDNANRVIQRGT